MPVAVSDSTLVDYYPSASADQVGGVRAAVEHLLEHFPLPYKRVSVNTYAGIHYQFSYIPQTAMISV